MKELETILKNVKGSVGSQQWTEKQINGTLEEVKDLIDIAHDKIKEENIEDKEEEFKRLRFAIGNILRGKYIIFTSIDKDKIKSLAEEIAKCYLK